MICLPFVNLYLKNRLLKFPTNNGCLKGTKRQISNKSSSLARSKNFVLKIDSCREPPNFSLKIACTKSSTKHGCLKGAKRQTSYKIASSVKCCFFNKSFVARSAKFSKNRLRRTIHQKWSFLKSAKLPKKFSLARSANFVLKNIFVTQSPNFFSTNRLRQIFRQQ